MRGLKAVVLEKNGSLLTVLSSDGTFQKVRYKSAVDIGAEIEIPVARTVPLWRIGASVAAIFLLAFMGIFGWNIFQPSTAVAMLSVDINPSLQLTLDRKGQVLELQSLNPDAEQLLSKLPLKGEPWKEALNDIIEQSVNLNYLNSQNNWVLVGYSPIKPDQELPLMEIDTDKITERIEKAAVGKGVTPKVAVYALAPEERVQAQDSGLTLGEYALVNTAQKAGIKVEQQDVKKTEERRRILERPEIQEQMKKDKKLKDSVKKIPPAGENPRAEKAQEFRPTQKESMNQEEDQKSPLDLNEKKWLFRASGLFSRGQWGKPYENSSRDKDFEEKRQGSDGKKDSDHRQSEDEKKNKTTGK